MKRSTMIIADKLVSYLNVFPYLWTFKLYLQARKQINYVIKLHTTKTFQVFIFFVFFILLGITPNRLFSQSEKPDIHFHHLPVQELSSPDVNGIYQDQTGFMWFSTNDGLNKFDGKRMTVYHPYLKDTLKRRAYIIKNLYEDQNGIFWISTWNSFSRFDPTTGEFKIYNSNGEGYEEKGPNLVLEVFEDSKKQLWLGTHLSGLHLFDPGTDRFLKQYPFLPGKKNQAYSLSHKRVGKIWEDGKGMIWVKTADLFLNRLDPKSGEIKKFEYPPFLNSVSKKNRIQLVRKDQFGKVWIGDKEHLYYWDPLSGEYDSFVYPSNLSDLINARLIDIHQDRSGIIWISIVGEGLKRWDPVSQQLWHYNHNPKDDQSIGSDDIKMIYEDDSGLIWLGTKAKGVIYFNPKPTWYKHFKFDSNNPNGLSGNNVTKISGGEGDKIWLAEANANVLNQFDPLNGTFKLFSPNNNLKGNTIKTVYESPNEPGILWIGYENAGLDRWDTTTGEQENYRYDTNDSTGISSNEVLSIYEDREGILWFGSQWGLSSLDRSSMQFKKYLHDKEDSTSISNNAVWSINEDREGNLWVGTESGLNELDRKTEEFRRYLPDDSDPNSISNKRILIIFEDSRGMLWVGCPNGLNLMDRNNGTFTYFSNFIMQSSDNFWKQRDAIRIIEEDDEGKLWLGTGRGISVLSEINEKGFNINHIDMLGEEFIGGFGRAIKYKSENGNLYFGNANGLFVIYPDRWKEDSIAAMLVFTDFKLANETVPVTRDGSGPLSNSLNNTKLINLSYKADIISFEFSMLDYKNPALYQYAYRLEGFNNNWIHIGNQGEVTFTNLDPGDYTLHVKAANENGSWNIQQAKISFTIVPAWWQTNLFKVVGLLFLFLLGFFFYNKRTRDIKQKNIKLRQEVDKRTSTLNTALQDLKTTQSELVQSEKMALLGTLIAGVAHEVNNPLGAITASNSNLIQSTKYLNEHFPKIFQVLSPDQQDEFGKLINKIPFKSYHIIGKERRTLKKQLTQQFETANLPNPDQMAEIFTEIGVIENLEPFYKLLGGTHQELILEVLYHSAQVQNSSQNIKIAADRAGKIVYALRSYSHNYESDTRISVDVSETVDNVLVLFHNSLKKGVEVHKKYDTVPLIPANPDELQQVWTNIVQNALQAMIFKGNLNINIDQRVTKKLGGLSFDKPRDFVVVAIADDGPGIPDSIRPRIFDPLITTKSPGEGSGLGLHICQRIIRDHKGDITFQSEPGKTTFEVWLPVENV